MAAEIRVRVQPRGRRDQLDGVRGDGVLLACVCAPPLDGKANRALCRLIAECAGVARSRVTVVRGERSRDKLVRVEGVEPAVLNERLGLV